MSERQQIGDSGGGVRPQAKLSMQTASQPPSAGADGAGPVPQGHRWSGKHGGTAAKLRFEWALSNWPKDKPRTARQTRVLEHVSWLEILYLNACDRASKAGPARQDGEATALSSKVIPDYYDRILKGLAEVYGDDPDSDDPLSQLLAGGQRR